MTQNDLSDAQIDRARIDGGFGFALAAFVLGLGLLAVLDRIGLPDDMLRIGTLGLIFSGLVVIAVSLRTMRPVDFYAGGRRLPGTYAGIAFAGGVFGLFLPFLAPSPGISVTSAAAGFGIGCIWALFTTGPILRRSGAYSFADLIASRFPHILVRGPVVLLMACCAACVALGGYAIALQSLTAATGLDRSTGAAILGGLLIVLVVPAGLSGVLWVAAAAAVVTVVALILPLGLGLVSGLPLALPIFGDQTAWSKAVSDFALVTSADTQAGFELPIMIAIGLGLATLAPLFGASIATRDEGAAWRSGLVGMVWLALIASLAAASIAASTLALDAGVSGRMPAQLPSAIVTASGRGEIAVCGVHASDAAVLTRACAAQVGPGRPLRMQDLKAAGDYLLESLPALRGSEPTLARLAAAFMIVLGMSIAASGVQFVITSLAHDILHPRRRLLGPTTRRLALTRLLAISLIILGSLWLARHSVDARGLFTIALMLSAALVTPLLALALMPRPMSASALAALCVAAFVTAHFLLFDAATMPPGELATDAIFAALDGLAVGLFVSFLPKRKAAEPVAAASAPAPQTEPEPDSE